MPLQVVADVAELKAAIAAFKEVIAASKDKQKQAKDDIKRLEKDMDDFKQNKDSKLNELKVRPSFRPPCGCRSALKRRALMTPSPFRRRRPSWPSARP